MSSDFRVYDNLPFRYEGAGQGDGRKPAEWCGETQFDRILLMFFAGNRRYSSSPDIMAASRP